MSEKNEEFPAKVVHTNSDKKRKRLRVDSVTKGRTYCCFKYFVCSIHSIVEAMQARTRHGNVCNFYKVHLFLGVHP